MAIKLLIFDLDDTLISTEILYREAKNEVASMLEKKGVNFEEALKKISEIDGDGVRKHGTDIHRFPNSLSETYKFFSLSHGFKASGHSLAKKAGYKVYDCEAEIFPFTKVTLENLSTNGYTMCVLTRGSNKVQLKRVLDAGISTFFDQIFVVEQKTPDLFQRICDFYKVNTKEALMIGNSIYGDIYPALEAGLFGIHIKNGTYELESHYEISPEDASRMRILSSIEDLDKLLIGEFNE